MSIRITGTGSYIPELIKKNNAFINRDFYTLEENLSKHRQILLLINLRRLLEFRRDVTPMTNLLLQI